MNKHLQPTIVIPTFNEAENIQKLLSILLDLPVPGLKIIVVDDNSPDGTGEIADSIANKSPDRVSVVHRKGKLGLGTAYLSGFTKALQDGAEAVGQMDADFSHDPNVVIQLMEGLQNCDVVLGSRYVSGGRLDDNWPLWRKGLSAFGNIYARIILNLPLFDCTGGYRIWKRKTLMGLPIDQVRSNGYSFQIELAYIAHKKGFNFLEIPIYFSDRRWGKSKMSFDIQLEAAYRVWQMRYKYRHLTPS